VIKDNLNEILEKIAKSAVKSGRKTEEITLVAVTKTVGIEQIKEITGLGVKNVGENRVQSALSKYQALSIDTGITWHMIGHLQSNKAKKAAEIFNFIQSIDSLELAKEVDKQAHKLNKHIKCLVELKVSEEPSKFGIIDNNIKELLDNLSGLGNLVFCGLMSMAPYFDDPQKARPYFSKTKKTLDDIKHLLKAPYSGAPVLSMGMSNDFESAIEEGATMVRIGTAIFK